MNVLRIVPLLLWKLRRMHLLALLDLPPLGRALVAGLLLEGVRRNRHRLRLRRDAAGGLTALRLRSLEAKVGVPLALRVLDLGPYV
jgi:hypothetical protein